MCECECDCVSPRAFFSFLHYATKSAYYSGLFVAGELHVFGNYFQGKLPKEMENLKSLGEWTATKWRGMD